MALRLRDLFTHPSRRQPTVIGQKASRALALDNAMRMSTVGYGTVGPKLKDYESYLRSYKIPWVRACVQVIAYNCANIGFRLVKPGPGNNGDEDEDEEILDSPFLDLLNHPNPYQSGFELREAWWTDLELTGNAYIELASITRAGLPTELYRLNPARMTVLPDRYKFIRGYRYTVNGRSVEPDYAPGEILHPKYANPMDPYYGMGVIESGEARFESEMAMAEHERNFWQSGAKITGILKTAETLDQPTFERITNTFRAFFQGSGYSTALLEAGLDYQSVSDGPAKLGMLDMAKASRDQILAMFGVPATKLGILEKANYKADEADRYFWTETCDPKLTRVEESLQPLVELFHPGEGLRMRFKRLNFSDDLPQMLVAEAMSKVGVFTADEIRQYTGRDPLLDHGDVLISPVGVGPLDLGGPMSTVNERRKDQGLAPLEGGESTLILPRGAVPLDVATGEVAPKPMVAGQPGASGTASGSPPANPRGGTTESPPNVVNLHPAPVAANGKAVTSVSVLQPATTHLLKQHRTKAIDASTAKYRPELETFFAGQEQRVLTALAAIPRRQKASAADGGWWDAESEDSALGDALGPLWTDALTAGVSAARSVGVPVKGETEARMQQLKQGLASRVTGINETTREALAAQVQEGLRRGYSAAQIASGVMAEEYEGVSGVFDSAKASRAETIARTEMMNAYNSANLDTYRQSGVVQKVQMMDGTAWDSACADRDGAIISLEEAEGLRDHPRGQLAFAPLMGTDVSGLYGD